MSGARAAGALTGRVMISLEELTKRFPGQAAPAVDRLSLDVPEGEIVVLVGPSGCGKTTTMKMVNRIIEPTSGRIVLDGEDVTKGDADQLRRRIGYVIQRIGLFPHRTIAENIATVPKLLGWDRARIDARIDELLEVVHMPPGEYRDRYPKELSGGQLQRVGVARALSGDPDVMLMDEPFGAIDPIVRERLQNEFLRLQSEVRKTIVFVTHDIDEAIKLGDRIAILQDGSRLAQYDTPERILTAPADDFVAEFIGSGAALKRLDLSRVADIELAPGHVVRADSSGQDALAAVQASESGRVLVLDEQDRPRRWVEAADVQRAEGRRLDEVGREPDAVVSTGATLAGALNELVVASGSVVVVTDAHGAYQGLVDISRINAAARTMPRDPAVPGADGHATVGT